ncbi:MAG: diguanylate cyclase [Anaerolineae bacterium]|nr:diguanylate cyclase [Anaerolineae bacterium]
MQKNFIGSEKWMEFLPQMQIVFDQLNDAVFIYDQTGEILLANKSASRLTGFETTEIIGKSIEAFVLLQTRLSEEKNRFLEYDQFSPYEYPKFQTEILTNGVQKIKAEITYLPLSNFSKPVTCLIAKNISEQLISTTLREINSKLSSSLSLVEVFDLLLVELRKLIRYDGGNIMKIGDNMATITRTLGYETFDEKLPNFLRTLHFDIETTQNLKTITNHKKPLIIHNTQQTPYWIHNEVSELFRSWIGVPIIIDNKVNAIISLDKVEPNYFTEEHTIILTNFSNQAASAIRNATFFKEATRAANRFMTLYQLSQIISTNIRTADIYPSIHQAVSELMETEFFGIALYDSSAQTITDVYMNDNGQPQKLNSRPLDKGLFATALKSGNSLLFNTFDSAKAEELEAVIMGDAADPEISQSILVVPLKIGAKSIGVISAQSYKPDMYTNSDRETLELLAANVAIAIENARLFDEVQKLAITDPLTNLNNRRKFDELASKEFDRSLRYKRPLCAIMIDLDKFKLVNDKYGHLIGDQVLASLADLCKKSLRNIDILARYGGEEFIIILPETTAKEALISAERLRQDCEENTIETVHGPITITISLGLADLTKTCKSLEELINRADQAMYESKRTGRNKTTIWTNQHKNRLHNQ